MEMWSLFTDGLYSEGHFEWLTAWAKKFWLIIRMNLVWYIWAATWQNQQTNVCQVKTQIQVSSCGQQRLWSDWADAEVDLSLRWAHMLVGFVVRWLICSIRIKLIQLWQASELESSGNIILHPNIYIHLFKCPCLFSLCINNEENIDRKKKWCT